MIMKMDKRQIMQYIEERYSALNDAEVGIGSFVSPCLATLGEIYHVAIAVYPDGRMFSSMAYGSEREALDDLIDHTWNINNA